MADVSVSAAGGRLLRDAVAGRNKLKTRTRNRDDDDSINAAMRLRPLGQQQIA